MTVAVKPLVETARRPVKGGRRFSLNWLGAVPFLAYVGIFLLLPTAIVVGGSFVGPDGLTLSNLAAMNRPYIIGAFVNTSFNSGGAQAAWAIDGQNFSRLLSIVVLFSKLVF